MPGITPDEPMRMAETAGECAGLPGGREAVDALERTMPEVLDGTVRDGRLGALRAPVLGKPGGAALGAGNRRGSTRREPVLTLPRNACGGNLAACAANGSCGPSGRRESIGFGVQTS